MHKRHVEKASLYNRQGLSFCQTFLGQDQGKRIGCKGLVRPSKNIPRDLVQKQNLCQAPFS